MHRESFTIRKGGELSRLMAYVSALIRGHNIKVTVEEYRPTRSTEQNALLWSLYTDIIRKGGEAMAGWTKDDLHEMFLIEHFGSYEIRLGKRRRLKPNRRSSKLNKQEFSEFVDFIVRYMAEQGVYLELPGDIAA